MSNYNSETGYPYGVISGNSVPEVLDDIISNGTDETFESVKTELRDNLLSAVHRALEDIHFHPEKLFTEDDATELLESFDGLWDYWECDEHSYSHEYDCDLGKVSVGISHLGGAPLIWVFSSPYVIPCRQCSPCVPGAGDMDNATADGSYAHCLPPEDMPEDVRGLVVSLASLEGTSDVTT